MFGQSPLCMKACLEGWEKTLVARVAGFAGENGFGAAAQTIQAGVRSRVVCAGILGFRLAAGKGIRRAQLCFPLGLGCTG